jgi:hypothetical protein
VAWDSKTPISIMTSRLLNSSPEAVYRELKDLATDHDDLRVWRDPKIEEALLQREDPLITLGLAQYCSSDVVASVLYKRGTSETGDPVYNKALRMAVLGNPLILRRIMSRNIFGVLTDEEVLQFINTEKEDETDELYAIVTNPGAKKLLGKLYNQEKPYDQISADNFVRATYWSHTNPVIREDESSVDGPDMQAWDVQKGITQMMQKMPLTDNGLRAAYWILRSVGTSHVRSFDEDPTPMFKRWESFKLTEEDNKYPENDAPDLTLREEFLVMLASVYGWYSAKTPDNKSKIIYLGSADSPDRYLRCAYYSDERKLTPEQMQKGHAQDGDAFVVAALYNEALFWNAKTRGELETMMRGRLIHRYKERCEQIKKRHPQFDMNPVSEQGAALLDDKDNPIQPTEDQKRLERVEVMLAATIKQLQSVYKVLTWVLILVIVAVVLIWRPHF